MRSLVLAMAILAALSAVTQCPSGAIGMAKLNWDGTHEVIFNGPGHVISDFYQHRQDIIGKQLLSFPLTKLRELPRPLRMTVAFLGA